MRAPRRTHHLAGAAPLALALAFTLAAPTAALAKPAAWLTHAPQRPLPVASSRPAASGPGLWVDAAHGDDAGDGSARHPWKTLGHAVAALHAGDTLYLHGGVYFETVTITVEGTAKAPVTIRSAPGELAIVDGGLREFEETPATAWEPARGDGAVADEYVSTAAYPAINTVVKDSEEGRGVFALGNFVDSMVPVHGYRLVEDLRSTNEYFDLPDKMAAGHGLYVGPGVWLDPATHKLHARLAHTQLKSLGDRGYAGETDPRKVPMVIGVDRSPVRVVGSKHVRLLDLELRGSATHTLHVEGSDDVTLDGLTVYGGSPALFVRSTAHLRLIRSALRGAAGPWSSRASMKYRGASSYLLIADSHAPASHDWELAYDELTDSHDGLIVDSIKTLRLHHDRIDNLNDDGIYLTFPPRAAPPEDVWIYENYVSRVLTALSFTQPDDGSPNTVGKGVHIFRNVFDLRDGTYSWPPADAAADAKGFAPGASRMCGDHGSPTWDPMFFYLNTVIAAGPVFRNYYGEMMVMGTKGTQRRLFDNIFVQVAGKPGLVILSPGDDLQVDGNLLWSVELGASIASGFFDAFRASAMVADSKRSYAPGWGAHDQYADPKLVRLDGAGDVDARLGDGSPAIDAGVALPADWPDTLRKLDKGAPDLGALPHGAPPLAVGPAAAPPPAP